MMYEDIFDRLSRSKFRSRFCLKLKDKDYLRQKGREVIRRHAEEFIAARVAPATIPNDGKQTPMKGHPVFIAQHATACCCRGCIRKWHKFPEAVPLNNEQQQYLVGLIMKWLQKQMEE